jgi:REP element-mobilizing transposase RayT
MPSRPQNLTTRTRGYLPHLESRNATYSVTFRLADSLPQQILDSYRRERQSIVLTAQQMNRPLSSDERQRLHELFSEKIESHLDEGIGQCHLRNPKVAALVKSALHHFHARRYMLHAWCIMPNHVHALFTPLEDHPLETILHSWKSFTASEANKILARSGLFWMPEYYDHLIRDPSDFHHHDNYILNNPKKAGLPDWPWVGATSSPDARGP